MAGLTADVIGVGDVIRYDPVTDKYLRAQADSETNSNFMGVVESVSGTDFTVVYSGEISLPDSVMSTITGFTGAQVFYLSGVSAGKLTTTTPTNPGHVIKPVIITTGLALDGTLYQGTIDGIVVNSIGSRIAGDSTVDLSDIQPVGSVSAFAGNMAQIPSGWDICDGGLLGVTAYADLYSALNSGQIYGFVQTADLTKVANSGNGSLTTDNLAGSIFYISRPSFGTIKCTILSGTVSGDNVTGAEIFVDPLYVDGVSSASYHNDALVLNDQGRLYIGTSPLDIQYKVSSSPTKTKFKKPDLRARFVIGDSRSITGSQNTAFNAYTVGKMGGEEVHTLTFNEMPIHSHDAISSASLEGNISGTFNVTTGQAGAHNHNIASVGASFESGTNTIFVDPSVANSTLIPTTGTHTHTVNGNISLSASNLTPGVTFSIANAGGDVAHNNVPQHMVMCWIIKTRKDSYAKILKLGPSGGGAVIAKNTAKRWVRATSGTGCTTDIGYGTWGITRAAKGNYVFSHDLLSELGTTAQTQYIVEASVTKSTSGVTQMFIANPYNYGGLTFGVLVYDIIGATHSDNFQYLNLTVYGGGTAV
jgi:hypothetical protein